MALLDLWKSDQLQLEGKLLRQVIAFAGDGSLRDSGTASSEFRAFLRHLPSDHLYRFVDECLCESFTGAGFALQDLINEIGDRLGFDVTPGRYRGVKGESGHDGIWRYKSGHAVIVEVKTTDVYRIDLNTIAGYRKKLTLEGVVNPEDSSLLLVVGRQDTGDLEAQIRGSRYAWETRLISVDAMIRLLKLKEEVEDPNIVDRIHNILIPQEFTRLDGIVDIAFSTAEELNQDEGSEGEIESGDSTKRFTPVSFHDGCVSRLQISLDSTLIKKSRASFRSPDGDIALLCAVSKYHERHKSYWFAFHPHQAAFLEQSPKSYVAFGCGEPETLFLLPYADFKPWLDQFNITRKDNTFYWHVKIKKSRNGFEMIGKAGTGSFDINKYLLE